MEEPLRIITPSPPLTHISILKASATCYPLSNTLPWIVRRRASAKTWITGWAHPSIYAHFIFIKYTQPHKLWIGYCVYALGVYPWRPCVSPPPRVARRFCWTDFWHDLVRVSNTLNWITVQVRDSCILAFFLPRTIVFFAIGFHDPSINIFNAVSLQTIHLSRFFPSHAGPRWDLNLLSKVASPSLTSATMALKMRHAADADSTLKSVDWTAFERLFSREKFPHFQTLTFSIIGYSDHTSAEAFIRRKLPSCFQKGFLRIKFFWIGTNWINRVQLRNKILLRTSELTMLPTVSLWCTLSSPSRRTGICLLIGQSPSQHFPLDPALSPDVPIPISPH